MKTGRLLIMMTLIVVLFAKCGSKKEDTTTEWKEMDEFHMVMAETFHPFKDSADLAPVKSKASELVAAADKWSIAPLPEKVDNDDMKSLIQQLKSEAEALEDVVQTGNDTEIGEQLTKLHDLFHKIQEGWYDEGHHEH
jgi:hypothetical protein